MRVIFLKDVAKVGRKDEIKEISDGYGLNFLIPQGLAIQATGEKVAALKKRTAETQKEIGERDAKSAAELRALDGKQISMTVRANEQGHLFKGLTKKDISERLNHDGWMTIHPSMLDMVAPVKELGEHVIHLAGAGVEATITLVVHS